jgi:hypothetical protein
MQLTSEKYLRQKTFEYQEAKRKESFDELKNSLPPLSYNFYLNNYSRAIERHEDNFINIC